MVGLNSTSDSQKNQNNVNNDAPSYFIAEKLISGKDAYDQWTGINSTEGRSGRFSYFFYSILFPFLLFWVMAAIAGVIGKMGSNGITIAYILLAITIVMMLVIFFQQTAKRCRDFNASGWVSILILIPFACIFFWLIPGNDGPNKYGDAPAPATTLLKAGCLILIATMVATMTYYSLSVIF